MYVVEDFFHGKINYFFLLVFLYIVLLAGGTGATIPPDFLAVVVCIYVLSFVFDFFSSISWVGWLLGTLQGGCY